MIFSISFIIFKIFKIKENNIDNWNIKKEINNNIIEKFRANSMASRRRQARARAKAKAKARSKARAKTKPKTKPKTIAKPKTKAKTRARTNDSVDDMCNNATNLFNTYKNLTDNNDIKKTIIKAVCNEKRSLKGDEKRKEVYKLMKIKQNELNKKLII